MLGAITITGTGHAVGSKIIASSHTSEKLGLPLNSLEERTGIVTRHVCAENETVTTLAVQAVQSCLTDAQLDNGEVGPETVLIYIENGMTHLTPPAGILLSQALQIPRVRVLSLDGVCSEPIHALEIAALMLCNRRCERVIVCASADFLSIVDDNDQDTAGLFGSGAGALLVRLAAPGESGAINGLYWETDSDYWDLGTITMTNYARNAKGVTVDFTYYQMKGSELARVAVRSLQEVIGKVLAAADWSISDVEHVISHQPNPKVLEIGARKLGLPLDLFTIPGKILGNMGPASVLIALSMLRGEGKLSSGKRVLLLSFGLGFSCGCAAVTI